jgi:hypothetical protein
MAKIKYFKFPIGKAATILTKVVTSYRLFRLIQTSVITTIHFPVNQETVHLF